MNDISLNDWLTFAFVVEEKGFTAAAHKLGLSPSIVSKRISQLEKNVGARLFQRSTRSLVLTESGQLFYEHCSKIKAEIELAKHAISASHQKPIGTLRIFAPMSFGPIYLTPAIAEFINQYPNIQVELILGSQMPNLIENSLDVAFSIKEPPDSRYIAKRITTRSIGIYGSPQYFQHYGIPQYPQDLSSHNCLCYQHQTPKLVWHFLDEHHQSIIVKVNGNFKVNSSQALLKAAIAGLGIAKLPSFIVGDAIEQGKLVRVLKKFCKQDIGIYAIYPNKTLLATKTRLFIEFVEAYFAKQSYWHE